MRRSHRKLQVLLHRLRHLPWKRIVLTLVALFLASIALVFVFVRRECRTMPPVPSAPAAGSGAMLEERYRRSEDNTYLTFPEWYIVYSAEEYASTLKDHRPSSFPYWSSAGQYWCAYGRARDLTKGRYAFNGGYHLTLGVIGVSFTAEAMVKGVYENTIGRVFEWFSFGLTSVEDTYAQEVAEEYGTFLHTIPWYEFPFHKKLLGLWQLEPFGDAPLRKIERRIVLTLEYTTKALYGWVIKKGTQSAYGPEDLSIRLVTSAVPEQLLKDDPRITVETTLIDDKERIVVPRYEAFSQVVPALARSGVGFFDIAGNDEILLTAIVPRGEPLELPGAVSVLNLRVLIDANKERMGWRVPVTQLADVIAALDAKNIAIEHLYDY